MEHCLWDYHSFLPCDGDEVKVTFHPVPSTEVQEEILTLSVNQRSVSDKSCNQEDKEGGEKPKFWPQPNFTSPNFDFQADLKRLPFPINLGEVDMSKEQKVEFLELIYDNHSVYLLHHTILVQLQAGVWKCLGARLRQGIIRPSCSPYGNSP